MNLVTWQKISINILSIYLIIFVSQSITCLLFPVPDNDKSLYLYPVSTFEVEELIDSLAHKASSGDDCSSNIIIKLSVHVTVCFMTHIINCSFTHGFCPESLKNAKILPLHKEGSKLEENNYRPISFLNVWSKI